MMRSTDTWHGRPNLCRGLRRRGQHAFGAAGVDHDRRRRPRALGEPAFERRDRCVRARRRCRLRWSARARRRARGRSRGRTARRRAARRRTACSVTPRARSASASAANGASPTPPATIQASRRRIDERERAAERSEARGDLSGPRGVDQRRRRADALVQERDARSARRRRRAALRTRKTAGGAAGRGSDADLDHHELSRRGGGGDCRAPRGRARCSRPTAGGWRSLPRRRRWASRQYTP